MTPQSNACTLDMPVGWPPETRNMLLTADDRARSYHYGHYGHSATSLSWRDGSCQKGWMGPSSSLSRLLQPGLHGLVLDPPLLKKMRARSSGNHRGYRWSLTSSGELTAPTFGCLKA